MAKDLTKNLTNDWRKHLYGGISGASIEALLVHCREAWRIRSEVTEGFAEKSVFYLAEKLRAAPAWWALYAEPYSAFALRLADVLGLEHIIVAAASTESPSDDFVERMQHVDLPDEPPKEVQEEAIAVAFVMQSNVESIAHYSCSMHDLVAKFAVDQKGLKALQRACAIDVTVLALPSAQAIVRAFQLKRKTETKPLSGLLRSVVKGPHGNIAHRELRWMEYILRDRGAFEVCSQNELHDLLVNRLHLYPDDEAASSKESLFKLIRKWQAEARN